MTVETESPRARLRREREDAVAALARMDAADGEPVVRRARRQATNPSQVYTLRIPVERLGQLRDLADAMGEAPSTLMRQWVLERLELERRQASSQQPPLGSSPFLEAMQAELQEVVASALKQVVRAVRAAAREQQAAIKRKLSGPRAKGSHPPEGHLERRGRLRR